MVQKAMVLSIKRNHKRFAEKITLTNILQIMSLKIELKEKVLLPLMTKLSISEIARRNKISRPTIYKSLRAWGYKGTLAEIISQYKEKNRLKYEERIRKTKETRNRNHPY